MPRGTTPNSPIWWDDARCRDEDPELFFPEGKGRLVRRRRAIALCCSCPRVEDCLRFALKDDSLTGIWGATDAKDRKRARSYLRQAEESGVPDESLTPRTVSVGG